MERTFKIIFIQKQLNQTYFRHYRQMRKNWYLSIFVTNEISDPTQCKSLLNAVSFTYLCIAASFWQKVSVQHFINPTLPGGTAEQDYSTQTQKSGWFKMVSLTEISELLALSQLFHTLGKVFGSLLIIKILEMPLFSVFWLILHRCSNS